MSHKRLWFGLATMILVQIVASNLAAATGLDRVAHSALQSVLVLFLAAFAGGAVARRGFVPLALAVWLVLWAAISYILYKIAAPTGQASLSSILQYNWVAFLLSGAATGIGAYLGQVLAANRSRRAAAT